MLEEAKQNCDYLIIGLESDPTLGRPSKNQPAQTVVERYIQLKVCKFVDEIVPYATEQDLEDILRSLKLMCVLLVKNSESKILLAECIVKQKGLNCILMQGTIGFQVLG